MKRQNDGKDEINALQNQFTAYLLVAVRRQKFAYIDKQNKLNGRELSVDYQLVQFADNSIESNQCMGTPIQQMEDTALMQALEHLTARERYILFERVLGERSYKELSGSLGLRYNGTVAAYRRMYKRYERAGDFSKKPSSKDLSYSEYYEWLERATGARDRYLAGILGEKEALEIICADNPKVGSN